MTEPSMPTSDSELEQALERARTAPPTGSAPTNATLALAAAVLLGSGFLGGYLVGGRSGDELSGPGGFAQRVDGPAGPGAAMPANLTMGTIESIAGNTFTVKTESGDTVKVRVVDATTIRINKEGSIKDLAKGDNVVVNGQRDGDTIEAENVGSGMLVRHKGGPAGAGG
jgi:hypothetical protein